MMSVRYRPRSIEKINESDSKAVCDYRTEFVKSFKFLRMLSRQFAGDSNKAVRICALALRETNGWSYTEIGLVFGVGARSARGMVEEGRASLPKSIAKHFDHRADTVIAIKTENAETLLDFARKMRKFFPDDDRDLDAAIDALQRSIAVREEE